MNCKFKSIGIIGKYADPHIDDTIRTLADHLKSRGVKACLDEGTASNLPNLDLPVASREKIGTSCDLAIVVGGDGTFLDAARSLSDHGIPLVGVNLGRLGFLVDVSPTEIQGRLDEILNGEYTVEERFLLHAQVIRDGKTIMEGDALNDVVLHKWEVARMIEFATYINGSFVHTHRSDGLIISTPTGSTAYALSGGGPILHPMLDAVVLVPICPHTLSHRPLVVHANNEIEIVISHAGKNDGQITCDGQIHHRLEMGDRIRIHTKSRRLQMLHPKGYDYYQILRAKLHWAEHP